LRRALLLVSQTTDYDCLSVLHKDTCDRLSSRDYWRIKLHLVRRLVDFLLNEQRHVSVLIDRRPHGEFGSDVTVLDDLIARRGVGRETPAHLHKRPLRADQKARFLVIGSEQDGSRNNFDIASASGS